MKAPTHQAPARPADVTVDLVLAAVDLVPEGRVVTYGDIAALVGTSARRVGTIMAQRGGEVPWWRVTNAQGGLPPHLLDLARKRWELEGIGWRDDRCLIRRHRADPLALAEAYDDLEH